MKKPMKKGMKIALIVATSLFAVGIALSTVGFVMMEGNFSLLATETYRTVEFEITDEFSSIDILVNTSNVILEPSADGKTKVCAFISEKNELFAEVTDGTLSIHETREGGFWNFIAVNFETPSVVLYIPEGEYDRLSVESNTGDLDTDEKLSFSSLFFGSDTGDAKITSPVSDKLEAMTDTGDIRLSGISPAIVYIESDTGDISIEKMRNAEHLEITTDTGKIKLTTVHSLDAIIESDTGDVKLTDVVFSNGSVIKTSTGDVEFEAFDSEEIHITTSTGDVEGELLSSKVFITDTSTGNVRVPYSIEGGVCNVKTSTGDIKINVIDPSARLYVWEKEGAGSQFYISLFEDGSFQYYEGFFSSHIGMGTWTREGDIITLTEDESVHGFVFKFRVSYGDLLFIKEGSDKFLYTNVEDGDRFLGSTIKEDK